MNVNYMVSLMAVAVLFLLAYVGVEAAGVEVLFGIIIPYLAVITFFGGVIYRVIGLGAFARSVSDSHHRGAAGIAALDQAGQIRQSLFNRRRDCADGLGSAIFPLIVP
jgi:hypothetical protein